MELYDQNGRLDSDVQDALYELGNVGVGMASVTIGKILGVRVELVTPNLIPADMVVDKYLRPDIREEMVELLMMFSEPMRGAVLFSMNRGFIGDVLEKMTGEKYEKDAFYEDEIASSALREFTSMLSAAYMKAISSYTGLRIYMSPRMVFLNKEPYFLRDMMAELESVTEQAISIETSFMLLDNNGGRTQDAGQIAMLPDEKTVCMLMESLGL